MAPLFTLIWEESHCLSLFFPFFLYLSFLSYDTWHVPRFVWTLTKGKASPQKVALLKRWLWLATSSCHGSHAWFFFFSDWKRTWPVPEPIKGLPLNPSPNLSGGPQNCVWRSRVGLVTFMWFLHKLEALGLAEPLFPSCIRRLSFITGWENHESLELRGTVPCSLVRTQEGEKKKRTSRWNLLVTTNKEQALLLLREYDQLYSRCACGKYMYIENYYLVGWWQGLFELDKFWEFLHGRIHNSLWCCLQNAQESRNSKNFRSQTDFMIGFRNFSIRNF